MNIHLLVSLALLLVMLVIHIGIAVWVHKDTNRRGPNALIWTIVVLFTGVPGWIIYLIARPLLPTAINPQQIPPNQIQPGQHQQQVPSSAPTRSAFPLVGCLVAVIVLLLLVIVAAITVFLVRPAILGNRHGDPLANLPPSVYQPEGETRSSEAAWIRVMERIEPWWAANTDRERNKTVSDPNGGAGDVLQVWGEHGWWATFRSPLPKCRKLTVRGEFMFGGGDAGPWITIRQEFQGANATDVGRFGFDDQTYPPKISGNPVNEKTWYSFEYVLDRNSGKWSGSINNQKIAGGDFDSNKEMNWLCLDAGQPGFFKNVEYLAE